MMESKRKDNRQAVYKHYHGGVLFYIGCGSMSYGRPYQKNSRNNDWWSFCNGEFEVEIVEYFDEHDKKLAENLEKELILLEIKKETPLVNIGIGKSYRGENNGMYGKGHLLKGKVKTEEHLEKIRIANIGKMAGKKNPMYGISMLERMNGDEEKYQRWKENVSKSQTGAKNPLAIGVHVFVQKTGEILSFPTIKAASDFTKISYSSLSNQTCKKDYVKRDGFIISRKKEVLDDLLLNS